MTRATRWIAGLAATVFVVAGCGTLGGRTAGQWVDDKTTIAKVKAALASTRVGTLTRVNVDTFKGTVYLSGVVPNESVKRELVDAAQGASDGRPVVSNLAVAGQIPSRDDATAASPAATTPLTRLKFSRMDAEPDVPGRFAAYNGTGQRVATVYTLLAWDLEQDGVFNLDAGERQIHHISVYPHPGSDAIEYHVVLWHVSHDEAASLQ